MKQVQPVGRQAQSRKYDLLTAIGVHACRGDKHFQRLALRLLTLIVARYNWQHDELSVGQREIAQLWSVDERTVKRDMAKLRDIGWLVQKRAALRGRVAVHGLDFARILEATAPDWHAVGPDFQERMGDSLPKEVPTNIVAFPGPAAPAADLPPEATPWEQARHRLEAEDPALFSLWFRQLQPGADLDGQFRLIAPSRFHATFVRTHHLGRLLAALRAAGLATGGVEIGAR
jgi:hypothetical protein